MSNNLIYTCNARYFEQNCKKSVTYFRENYCIHKNACNLLLLPFKIG